MLLYFFRPSNNKQSKKSIIQSVNLSFPLEPVNQMALFYWPCFLCYIGFLSLALGDWVLTFEDDFSGSELNSTTWLTRDNFTHGSQEWQLIQTFWFIPAPERQCMDQSNIILRVAGSRAIGAKRWVALRLASNFHSRLATSGRRSGYSHCQILMVATIHHLPAAPQRIGAGLLEERSTSWSQLGNIRMIGNATRRLEDSRNT